MKVTEIAKAVEGQEDPSPDLLNSILGAGADAKLAEIARQNSAQIQDIDERLSSLESLVAAGFERVLGILQERDG